MSYSFTGEWSEALQQSIKSWLIDTWTKINNETPDQDFIEYILVMVKNQKKMSDISNELKDLGIEEALANDFVKDLQTKLSPVSENKSADSSEKSKDVVASSSSKRSLDAPLKSSRESGANSKLNSALSSSRKDSDSRDNKYNDGRNNDGKRSVHDRLGGRDGGRDDYHKRQKYDRDGNRDHRDNGRDNYRKNPPLPPNPPPPQGMPPQPGFGADNGLDAIKYFEHMNNVAIMSGFKNAQEMMASQREMMAIMSGPPMAPPPGPFYPPQHFEGAPPAPHFFPGVPAPYEMTGAPVGHTEFRGRGGGFGGRGYSPSGRGFTGGRHVSGGRWYKGGTGRGAQAANSENVAAPPVGDAPAAVVPPPAESAPEPVAPAVEPVVAPAQSTLNPNAAPFSAGTTPIAHYSGGRGSFRGGGRNSFRGRGPPHGGRGAAPVNKNKVWTRETTTDSSLVVSR